MNNTINKTNRDTLLQRRRAGDEVNKYPLLRVHPELGEGARRLGDEVKTIIILFALILLTGTTYAQNSTLLQKFQQANTKADMTYEYKVVMRNMHTAKDIDSTKGRLYARGGEYLDSNTHFLTARVGDDFCKLDYQAHTATIASIAQVTQKTGIPFVNNEQRYLFNITDSLLQQHQSKFYIDSTNARYYRLKARIKDYPLSYIQIDFWRSNYKMAAAYYESEEHNPNDPNYFYLTRIHLFKINQNFDNKIFQLSRIFTRVNTQPILNKKYAKYTIIPIP